MRFLVRAAVFLGVVCSAIGMGIGAHMASVRIVINCPDGTEFPAKATNFNCYAHPHAGVGTVYIVLSLMLGILICLCGVIVWRLVLNDPT
jgi:hypothetical protein